MSKTNLPDAILKKMRCPVTHEALHQEHEQLINASSTAHYPIDQGIACMIPPSKENHQDASSCP